jgi:thymidine phosphorylase
LGETLDLSVGFSDIVPIGTRVDEKTPLAVVHAASEGDAGKAVALLQRACTLSKHAPGARPVVYDILEAAHA